jgi:hypothetical protein
MTLNTFTRLACISTLLAASASQAQVNSVGMRQIQSNGMPITLVYHTAAAAPNVTYGAFTDADRQKAFDQIAVFLKQKLSQP